MTLKLLATSALAATLMLSPLCAMAEDSPQELAARIKKLEEELAILKRQNEVNLEKQQAEAEKTPTVEYKGRGLIVTSPDKEVQMKLGGYAQADNRTFFDNSNTTDVDQFLIRTARLGFQTKLYDHFATNLVVDFGSSQVEFLDAYVDYLPSDYFNVRFGKFKAPLGLERWQSEQELMFVERSLANSLVPYRDIGFMFYGQLMPKVLEYQIAFTNGQPDLADLNNDVDSEKDLSARVFANPFRNSDVVPLQGFGIGIAGSYGEHKGTTTNSNLTTGYRTPAQSRYFAYGSGAFANGDKWRINPQTYYYYGPFGALAEYIYNSQEVSRLGSNDTIGAAAWNIAVGYVLTGENASFSGILPSKNFNPEKGNWGAFEVVARYSNLEIDDEAFPTFASLDSAASSAEEFAAGLNWYLNPNIKINTDFAYTTFDGGAPLGADREPEKVFLGRTQFRF